MKLPGFSPYSYNIKKEKRAFYQLENINLHKNGSVVILETNAVPIIDKRGFLRGYRGIDRDITNRKKTQQQLQQTQQQLHDIIEQANDWIWEIDAEGTFTFSNRKVKDILGYEPEEIIGKTALIFTPPEEITRVTQIFLNAAENKAPIIALENTNLHKNGSRVVLETSAMPILDEQKAVIGYRGIDRDITARKNYENNYARLSLFDPLTNLPNRSLFIDRLNQLIRLRKNKKRNVSEFYSLISIILKY